MISPATFGPESCCWPVSRRPSRTVKSLNRPACTGVQIEVSELRRLLEQREQLRRVQKPATQKPTGQPVAVETVGLATTISTFWRLVVVTSTIS